MARLRPYVAKPAGKRNPVKVRAGQIGGRKRWGAPHIVRLDGLSDDQRYLLTELASALRAERPPVIRLDDLTVPQRRLVEALLHAAASRT